MTYRAGTWAQFKPRPTNLNPLVFSSTNFPYGAPSSGTISGATPGSVLTLSRPLAGLTINSDERTWAFDGRKLSGYGVFMVCETLRGHRNQALHTAFRYTNLAGTLALGTLGLSAASFTVGTASSGTITGATAGSTIMVGGQPSGFTIDSAARTWSYDGGGAASSGNLTLTEALAGATNSPRVSEITWTVTVVAPVLGALAMSPAPSGLTVGTSASGTITGATAGSAIGLTHGPTGLTVNSVARTWAYDGSGSAATGGLTLTETLAGTTGSPKATAIAWAVVAAPHTTPDAFTFTDVTGVALGSAQASDWRQITGINVPASVSVTGGQWQAADDNAGTNATAASSASGTIAPSKWVRALHTASSSNGTPVNTTLTIGGVSDTFTSTTAAALSSTSATRTSADGAAPEVDLTMGADIFDGYILEVTRRLTNSSGAGPDTWGAAVATGFPIEHYVTPTERAEGKITKAALVEDGYSDPSGYYEQAYRWKREDGVTGPWSVISDTVVASVAVLNSGTGVNKHSLVTVSNGGLSMSGTAGVGFGTSVRATVAGAAQSQFEITIISLDGADIVGFGLCDTATDLNSGSWKTPGGSDNNGIRFQLDASNSINALRNTGSNNINGTGGARAVGDVYTLRRDVAGSEVRIYRRRSGAETLILTVPWSSAGFDYAYLYTANGSVLTANFGASAFQHALDAGFAIYG